MVLALAAMPGRAPSDHVLSDEVMQLEQARDAAAADALRMELAAEQGSVVEFRIATDGLKVRTEGDVAAAAGRCASPREATVAGA